MNFVNNNENCIEFLNNQHSITVSFCMPKWINNGVATVKLETPKKLYETGTKITIMGTVKGDWNCKIASLYKQNSDENKDGSICAKLPVKFLKISAPRKVSEEQRQAASERFKKIRENMSSQNV